MMPAGVIAAGGTTTHVVVGAALLATCLVLTLRAGRAAVVDVVAPGLHHAVPA